MNDADQITPAVFFRALKAAVLITALFGVLLVFAVGWPWAHSFVFFSLWSVANLFLLGKVLVGTVSKGPKIAVFLWFLCLPALFLILLLFFAQVAPNVSAFGLGFHLPYLVVGLKIAGWHMARTPRRASETSDFGSVNQAREDG
jgi:hypothetical protein